MTQNPPGEPAGSVPPVGDFDPKVKKTLVRSIQQAPGKLRKAVSGLTGSQLDTLYKNWTIRQIVHHIADSHVHSYVRFKWALTEANPTIKAYEEADWVLLADAQGGDIEPPMELLSGLHSKWVQTLQSMSEGQFARTFVHPQSGETVTLWSALNYYPWHSRHHTAQIVWLRKRNGW